MPELVSVLIPAYNAESWLATAVRSALEQTWPRLEVIIVDDGSRDDTLGVARAWESSRVKVFGQPNMGAPAARNKALEFAQGTYIQWLDADDVLDPRKIALQMDAAEKAKDRYVLLSCPFGTFYYRTKKATFVETSLWTDLSPVDYFLRRFNENICFQTDAWLVSRELTEASGPWTDSHSPDDDGEYFCRVVKKSHGIKFVREARSFYRVGNVGSLANSRSRRAVSALFASKVKCIRYLLEIEDTARSRAACLRLLQDWMPWGYEDLVAEARRLADELGGSLHRPVLKWKYRPIEWLSGYDAALKASRILPAARGHVASKVDRLLSALSNVGVVDR